MKNLHQQRLCKEGDVCGTVCTSSPKNQSDIGDEVTPTLWTALQTISRKENLNIKTVRI